MFRRFGKVILFVRPRLKRRGVVLGKMPCAERRLAEGLTLAAMSAWVGAEIVDGELQYVVSAGGFATKEAAEAALLAVGADMRFVGAEVVAIP